MDPAHTDVPIAHEADVAAARLMGGQLAEKAGFNTIQKHCLMISISELASNILVHAGKGSIAMKITERADGAKGIEIVASDHGQGISDIELAMQDGYSTGGGLGGGLSGVRRLMTQMEISSVLGQGTVVRAVKWTREGPFLPLALPSDNNGPT